MSKAKEKKFNPRRLMELAIEVMNQSIQEPRQDKVSPKVGAVLIKQDGTIETAFRGEIRHGDHAEFTLLERKNRAVVLDGSLLFATLEPCAPSARKPPKLGCAERIVNARIKKVWIGIEDPDPLVDRKGIKYLLDNGVEVEMFDSDLQEQIREANSQFIREAEDRAKKITGRNQPVLLTSLEKGEPNASIDDLSKIHLETFIKRAKLNVRFNDSLFYKILSQLGILEFKSNQYTPTGLGVLLFGNRPQLIYPQALIRATYRTKHREDDIETIEGPIIAQAEKIQNWYENRIGKQIERSDAQRNTVYDFPLKVFLEAIINAIVHRDYDIQSAPVYFEINDDAIIIKSPGRPVEPITLEQIKTFNAPSLSRNPKIMYIFDQLELVEQRGRGFRTIKELPSKYKLPLPEVSYDDPYLVFTFARSSDALGRVSHNSAMKELDEEEIKGLNFIRTHGATTRRDYEMHFSLNKKKAERHLRAFVRHGLVVRKGSGPGTYYESITT